MYGCDNYIGDYTMYTNGTDEAPYRRIETEAGSFTMFDCHKPKEELLLTMVSAVVAVVGGSGSAVQYV